MHGLKIPFFLYSLNNGQKYVRKLNNFSSGRGHNTSHCCSRDFLEDKAVSQNFEGKTDDGPFRSGGDLCAFDSL